LHVICKEDGAQYVAEYFDNYNPIKNTEELLINRYYNQIEDVHNLFPFGKNKDKLFIDGYDQLILTSFAVNRHVLLDMEK
jgi:hypothetical protein